MRDMIMRLYLRLLSWLGVSMDQVEEEVDDILADFHEKADKLQAVVTRYQDRLESIREEAERLQDREREASSNVIRAATLRSKLLGFLN